MNIYQQILSRYWGYSKFWPLQEDIIKSIANGHDTLGLMPTGGGKSVTFQVPAIAKEGICLVVTPLIALMKDQVEGLRRKGVKAMAVYSGMTRREMDIALENCIYGNFKFLYLSPERLNTEIFRARVQKMNVSLVAVDEAHCISQWGYDFRPSYLKITDLRELLPDVPFLAITATATPEVVDDIQEKLRFKKKNVLKTSFERKNLVYLVRIASDKQKYLLNVIKKSSGSGIVYVRTRRKTKEIADFLRANEISVSYYHAGLRHPVRSERQKGWTDGKIRVIVATNAFGMGIDKATVRFVIHVDIPNSLEAYFQEAGRAGRDGKKAYAVMLYNESDKAKLDRRIGTGFPPIKVIKRVYEALGNYFQIPVGGGKNGVFDFNIADFISKFKFNAIIAYNSLKFLEREGYIELTDELNNPSKVLFLYKRDDLYKFQVENSAFDGFIKLLLRSYTGLFTEFVSIDEQTLAGRAKISRELVYEFLKKLNNFKVISYIPGKRTSLIIYTEERLDQKSLIISTENYKIRKEKFIKRLEKVNEYASRKDICRSRFLLEYFGEEGSPGCGHCDFCKGENKMKISKTEFEQIAEMISKCLKKESMLLEKLVDTVDHNKEKTVRVIQWLLDNEKIYYRQDKKIGWGK
ncbi:MAG: RecQ family ATP-dependent DNA helicase [Bacteroidetes bacterium]|nr:RecQ family ATP-dependent DNA helicase [Bacteroidota bacterium]